MATYKRRGYKVKNKQEQEEVVDTIPADQTESVTAEVFNTLDEGASKTEEWVAGKQKYIFGLIGGVAVLALGYVAYQQFVKKPKEKEASYELSYAQANFNKAIEATQAKDSLYNLALNGADGKYGLLEIIENYSGTDAANLASYSAGMAYLNTQKYQEAITHLQQFSSNEDMLLGALANGGIADAFMQLNQPKDALGYYKKAIAHSANDFTTPKYLLKAGVVALELGDKKQALGYFNRIKQEFSTAVEARTIDMFIGKASN